MHINTGLFALVALLVVSLTGAACQLSPAASLPAVETASDYTPRPYVEIQHPEWARDAVIYQINTRQFTPEGTFSAAQRELPRLKELGVDILWLMPIHPIGEVNRKGTLGSPYSVKDFRAVNPEFGTLDDFRAFVDKAHELGFRVIIDWVANHSAWDNPLTEQHPEWYSRDWKGDFHPTVWTDWSDIIEFDYSSPGLRQYMTEAMVYWVRDIGIDGFRCDVAGLVPLDFWEELRRQLDDIRPTFLLAEWEQRDLHARAFNASYAWSWKDAARDIAQGRSDAAHMTGFLQNHLTSWPQDAMRMYYTENHDQNAWEGTPTEFYGEALETFMTLQFLMPGIPLIHNGQEAGNETRLEFFEKDPILWAEHPNKILIQNLIAMKKRSPALWNGPWGGALVPVMTDAPEQVTSFIRSHPGNTVLALFNLSPDMASVRVTDGPVTRNWRDAETGQILRIELGDPVVLPPWGRLVLEAHDTGGDLPK